MGVRGCYLHFVPAGTEPREFLFPLGIERLPAIGPNPNSFDPAAANVLANTQFRFDSLDRFASGELSDG